MLCYGFTNFRRMRLFFVKLCSVVLVPVSWTVLTVILLCLPGSAIPGTGLFGLPGLDKVVHVLLFGGIVWSWAYHYYGLNNSKWRGTVWAAAACATLLGIVLEFIQLYFIPGRSFDSYDIVADAGGALTATLILLLLRRNA